jgi:hypothetical protein
MKTGHATSSCPGVCFPTVCFLHRLDRLADVDDEFAFRVLLGVVQVEFVARPIVGLVAALRKPLAHQLVPRLAELILVDLHMPHREQPTGDAHRPHLAFDFGVFGNVDARAGLKL